MVEEAGLLVADVYAQLDAERNRSASRSRAWADAVRLADDEEAGGAAAAAEAARASP